MSKFGNQSLEGPYTTTIRYDNTVRDNCHASIEAPEAFRPYAVGESIQLKVSNGDNATVFTDQIKEKHEGYKYASIPVKEREKLELTPKEKVDFWVSNEDIQKKSTQIAIKPGSDVYHLVREGEVCCNHHHATKPGTSDLGFIFATLDEVGGDWRLCNECENRKTASNLTRGELVHLVKVLIGGGADAESLSSEELLIIANRLADDDEQFENAYNEVQE